MSRKAANKSIVYSGKTIRVGDSLNIILHIREKLFNYQDLRNDSHSCIFDSSMLIAVKRYQMRNGLIVDGKIGKAMIRSLNTSLEEIIRKIQINIDRFNKMKIDSNQLSLLINIPDFSFYIFEMGKLTGQMKVIVGKLNHETTQFDGIIRSVVFNPYWVVPPGILKNEIWPAVIKNQNYLRIHHMEKYGKTVRQMPGPDNPLGKIKFLFPNKYNIYMHDTPAKSLFRENSRMFSHGCIRIEDARRLAWIILKREKGWTENKFEDQMAVTEEQVVDLEKTVPVSIRYLTAWVDENGILQMRKDVYGLDGSK
jgi:murein L,D-transpeptidase YcbB/YkuD